jgi:hypothetical protein
MLVSVRLDQQKDPALAAGVRERQDQEIVGRFMVS